MISVMLVDDHPLVLEGLRAMMDAERDIQVVATTTEGERVPELVKLHRPDVVVLDLELGTTNGYEVLKRLRSEQIPIRVLVLTAYGDGESMRAALEHQADGIALKTDAPGAHGRCAARRALGRARVPAGRPALDAQAERARDRRPGLALRSRARSVGAARRRALERRHRPAQLGGLRPRRAHLVDRDRGALWTGARDVRRHVRGVPPRGPSGRLARLCSGGAGGAS